MFEIRAEGEGADLSGVVNPVEVALTIADDAGTTTVNADIDDDGSKKSGKSQKSDQSEKSDKSGKSGKSSKKSDKSGKSKKSG